MNSNDAYSLIKMPLDEVMSAADEIRRKNRSVRMELCAIINAKSGVCKEDCRFCAQSACHKTGIKPYPLISQEELLCAARRGKEAGAEWVSIVTSGKAPDTIEVERIASAVRDFSGEGIAPCASLGEISIESLKVLRDSGLKRYHHNIETSERFYPEIVSTHAYIDRIRTIAKAKNVGVEVCSGGIFGLGESWEDRVDMALALKELEVDSVPINFLMPIDGTPMAGFPILPVSDALRIIAIFRIILEKPVIKVAAGREIVFKDLQKLIFSAGADGMMVGGYLTVPGSDPTADSSLISETIDVWKEQLKISV